MSSILEALRKLEKEKVHRDEVSTAIASDILRSDRAPRKSPWKLPLLLFALLSVGAAAAFYLLTASAAPERPTPPVAAEAQPRASAVATTTAPTPTAEAGPALYIDLPVLSGIVYHERPEARMAILNDLPVMEGTVVDGFTLQRIEPDRVRLLRDGTAHILPLTVDR